MLTLEETIKLRLLRARKERLQIVLKMKISIVNSKIKTCHVCKSGKEIERDKLNEEITCLYDDIDKITTNITRITGKNGKKNN